MKRLFSIIITIVMCVTLTCCGATEETEGTALPESTTTTAAAAPESTTTTAAAAPENTTTTVVAAEEHEQSSNEANESSPEETEFSKPSGIFDDIKCGMSYEELVALFGKPRKSVENKYYISYGWDFVRDLLNHSDKRIDCTLICRLSDNELWSADYLDDAWSFDYIDSHPEYGFERDDSQKCWYAKNVENVNGSLSCVKHLGNGRTISLENISYLKTDEEDAGYFNIIETGMKIGEIESILGIGGDDIYINSSYDSESKVYYYKNCKSFNFGDNTNKPILTTIRCLYGKQDRACEIVYEMHFDPTQKIDFDNVANDLIINNSVFDGFEKRSDNCFQKKYDYSFCLFCHPESNEIIVSKDNYEYYESPSDRSEDTTDGIVGDNNGDGKIDEDDWEQEWNDWLEKKMDDAGV